MQNIMDMTPTQLIEYFASGQNAIDHHADLVANVRDGMFDGICSELSMSQDHPQRDHLKATYNKMLDAAVKRFDLDLTLVGTGHSWTDATLISFNSAFISRVNDATNE